ncbi:MAG: hypothetical protein NPIRA04_01780 [Nitrospirales bacterium]|nr:MAG: hypothetical protein NPIRA04_01780 [Nitrospirales bacterium]
MTAYWPITHLTSSRLHCPGQKSDNQLLDVIRNGCPGTAMSSWNGDFSDAETHDIFAYLRILSQ